MHDPRQDAVQVESLEQADSGRVQGVQLAVPCVQRLKVARCAQRHRRLVGEGPERLKALARRQHRVGGVIGPDEPAARAVSLESHESGQWRDQARGPAPPRSDEYVEPTGTSDPGDVVLRSGRAAFDPRTPAPRGCPAPRSPKAESSPGERLLPSGRSRRREAAVARETDHDLLELERLTDPARDRLEDVVGRLEVDQGRRDVEQPPPARPGRARRWRRPASLRSLRYVLGEGHEHVELLVGRAQARLGARRPNTTPSSVPSAPRIGTISASSGLPRVRIGAGPEALGRERSHLPSHPRHSEPGMRRGAERAPHEYASHASARRVMPSSSSRAASLPWTVVTRKSPSAGRSRSIATVREPGASRRSSPRSHRRAA